MWFIVDWQRSNLCTGCTGIREFCFHWKIVASQALTGGQFDEISPTTGTIK